MAFHYSDGNREEYFAQGFTILRGLIPAALLSDLRRETDKAREIARREHGPQAQRLQPVYRYPELDHRPFRDFLGLAEMRATVDGILGPDHPQSDIMGVLFEPREAAWATNWHRDWGHHRADLDMHAFFDAVVAKPLMFSQFNAALYEDHSLWMVPGSHNRPDTAAERAAFGGQTPAAGPTLNEGMTAEERELTCLTYARQMPGGVPVPLGAGDVAFYRAVAWHIGNYVPYTKRATLHDGFYGPDDRAWRASPPIQAATAP